MGIRPQLGQAGKRVYLRLNVGVESEKYSVQVYCSNCTQDTEIYRFVRIFDNRSGTNLADRSTVGGTPRRPRQFGVKGTWSF